MRALLPLLFAFLALPALAGPPSPITLGYHDVRDQVAGNYDPDQYAVSTRHLITQFSWLRENGYTPVSVDRIIEAREGGEPLPEKAVLLTFDDGLASVYTHVLPLLKLFDYPAVVSVVTSWIDTDSVVDYGGRELGRGAFLTWEQIRELHDSGLVEIASHSHDMHKGVLGNPQGNEQPAMVARVYRDGRYEDEESYRERVKEDLELSAELIAEHTGERPRVITWPYGAFNDTTASIAGELGMEIGLTLADETIEHEGTLRIGRLLQVANPELADFTAELLLKDRPFIVRAAQIELDSVYDPDPERARRNLDRLLDRIKELEISHVFLQAFSDPDGDGQADALYFPNRHLPVRADLFNRVAWQLKTRTDVRVYAWLPLAGFTGQAMTPERIGEIYEDLAIYTRFEGLLFHDSGKVAAARGEALTDLSLTLADRVRSYHPGLKVARNLPASALLATGTDGQRRFSAYLDHYDYVVLRATPSADIDDAEDFHRRLVAAARRQDPRLVGTIFELESRDWQNDERVFDARLRATMRGLQALGVLHLGYHADDFISGEPALQALREGFSLSEFPGELEL